MQLPILGIDPGPVDSGWAMLTNGPPNGGVASTAFVRHLAKNWSGYVAIEMIAGMGMAVGKETFDTCIEIGRMVQVCEDKGIPWVYVYRREVKIYLCGNMQAKDTNVRQAILDKYPRTGAGKCPQVGTKKYPGPLYGFSSHAWSALAVAITARDTK